MKNMSLTKLLVIFVLVFATIIGGTIFFVSATNKKSQITSSNKYNYSLPPTRPVVAPKNDVAVSAPVDNMTTPKVPESSINANLDLPSKTMESASASKIDEAKKPNQSYISRDNQVQVSPNKTFSNNDGNSADLSNQISSLTASVSDLSKRISLLEKRKADIKVTQKKNPIKHPVKVTMKDKESSETISNKTPLDDIAIPLSSGYKVQAVVGKRAWIQAGDKTETITVGDELPAIEYKRLRVTKIDADSGIVITSHDATKSKKD